MHPLILLIAGGGLIVAGFKALSEVENKTPKALAKSVPTDQNEPVKTDPEPKNDVEVPAPSPDSVDHIGSDSDGVPTAD